MKKILGVIILSLVLSGCAPPHIETTSQSDFKIITKQQGYIYFAEAIRASLITAEGLPDKMAIGSGAGASKTSQQRANETAMVVCGYSDCIISKEGDTVTSMAQEIINSKKKIVKKIVPEKQEEIMFTIKDKREQCEAIGFKPETEKFADCVLRLVELDVKQQTQNQIVSAQNSGNDALVKQLERQNNLQSSQALINLGQQLMNPKQNNSNIYMPQTRRCTVSGFGVTSVVRCY
jgi:hypothetical protein